jgi:hypothetical protein
MLHVHIQDYGKGVDDAAANEELMLISKPD